MKKLFDFIKNLFAKADEIEQKVEQFVAKSDFISPTIKKDVQSTLNKVNELEAKTKKVVAKHVVGILETESIDLSVYSPPFAGLYNYSSSENEFQSASKNHSQFHQAIDQWLRHRPSLFNPSP
mgnify:CR=1 FL=1